MAKLHSSRKLWVAAVDLLVCGMFARCVGSPESIRDQKCEAGAFSLLLVVLVRLHCWSSRFSPVVKPVCVDICLSLLFIVNAVRCLFLHVPQQP